jgi:hypothetical protein
VAGDDVVVGEVASYLRIEERELEAGAPNSFSDSDPLAIRRRV